MTSIMKRVESWNLRKWIPRYFRWGASSFLCGVFLVAITIGSHGNFGGFIIAGLIILQCFHISFLETQRKHLLDAFDDQFKEFNLFANHLKKNKDSHNQITEAFDLIVKWRLSYGRIEKERARFESV